MAAPPGSSDSPSTRAASAVEFAAICTAAGTWLARNFWHWARAWGYDEIRPTSPMPVPGLAIRWRWISMTTSRWM